MFLQIFGISLLSLLTIICIYDAYKSQRMYNLIVRINEEMEKEYDKEGIKKEKIIKDNGYDII